MGIMYTGGMKNKPEFKKSDLTVLEVARLFEVSTRAVYGWISKGRLEKRGGVVPVNSVIGVIEEDLLYHTGALVKLEGSLDSLKRLVDGEGGNA